MATDRPDSRDSPDSALSGGSSTGGGTAGAATPAVEVFLADFHDRCPGGTPRAFAPLAVLDAAGHPHASSYHALQAALLAALGSGDLPDGPLLDLACGDGHLLALLLPLGRPLVGADLSAGELAAAAARLAALGIPRAGLDGQTAELSTMPSALGSALDATHDTEPPAVTLYQARAQALPLADASVAAITCHMALMLMNDPAQVVAELGRVLRPGGRLLAVLPHVDAQGSTAQPLLQAWQAALRPEARDAGWQQVRFENRAWGDDQGLAALLRPAFTPLLLTPLTARQRLSPSQAWDWFAGMYDLHLLPAAAWPAVRARFMAQLPALQGDDGCVPLQFNYLLLDATAAA